MKPSTRILLMQKRLLTPIFLGSRLALWLDATDSRTIILDGSTVSQWRDKSGNGHHASQLNKASQPTYSLTGLNGNPVLTFDGVNDFLVSSASPVWNFLHNGSESSVIYLGKISTTGANPAINMVLMSSGSFTSDVGFNLLYTDSDFDVANNAASLGVNRGVSGQQAVNLNQNDVLIPGTWNIVANRFDADNAIAANRGIVNINGNADISTNTLTNAPSTMNHSSPLHIGAGIGNNNQIVAPFVGEMAEILIINGAISTYEQQELTGYLAHKRRLTANLPSDHPFKFRPPYM